MEMRGTSETVVEFCIPTNVAKMLPAGSCRCDSRSEKPMVCCCYVQHFANRRLQFRPCLSNPTLNILKAPSAF